MWVAMDERCLMQGSRGGDQRVSMLGKRLVVLFILGHAIPDEVRYRIDRLAGFGQYHSDVGPDHPVRVTA